MESSDKSNLNINRTRSIDGLALPNMTFAKSRKFCQRGSNSDVLFVVGSDDTIKSGP